MYKPRSIYVKVALETIIAKLGLGEESEREEEYKEMQEKCIPYLRGFKEKYSSVSQYTNLLKNTKWI